MDIGDYNRDPKQYQSLVDELHQQHPPITLPSEYAMFVEKNLLFMTIRLSRYKFVARMLSAGDEVLEVGCGSGLGAQFVAQHVRSVVGIETKAGEVADAEQMKRRENVEFIHGDFYDFDPDRQFDAIVSLDVIEHMEQADARRLLAKMTRHLRPNGVLIIGTPSIHSYPHSSKLSQASHIKCYDLPELDE